MKFALLNGQRQAAQPNLSGECPLCRKPVVAKCGDVRVHHWAHKGRLHCDPWWENETEWHRAWKNQFPADWQEYPQIAGDGCRHVADVKTGDDWVIEFQHSAIGLEERRSREDFYQKLVWVVDGTGKRNSAQLTRAWKEGVPVGRSAAARKAFSADCGLLQKWAGSNAPIFFDLGETKQLLWLFAKNANGFAYLHPFPRAQFIAWHRSTATEEARKFGEFVKDTLPKLIAAYEASLRAQPLGWDPLRPRESWRSPRL